PPHGGPPGEGHVMKSGLSRLLAGAAVAVMATAAPVSAAIIGVAPTSGHATTLAAAADNGTDPSDIVGIDNDDN
ncbi:MAG TPA: hypothetical protein VGD48_18355, partial [Kutzneria sp.]